jgi:hypothetical protein
MATFHKPTSPYKDTPVKDFFLDILVPRPVPRRAGDREITIEPKFDERPDLLSQELYGTPRLWWVFQLRNMDTIIDPIGDFRAGTQIFIPSQETVRSLL